MNLKDLNNSGRNFDCIIIGTGILGAGIARDLCLRDLSCLILEKGDVCAGNSGKISGLLHSGADFIFSNIEIAKLCLEEYNNIKKIAPEHIIDSGGYFVVINDDDLSHCEEFQDICKKLEIPLEEIPLADFLKLEPNCNHKTKRVFKSNDAYINPLLLSLYNLYDAAQNGALIKTHCEVKHLIIDEKKIKGVQFKDTIKNLTVNAYSKIVINATGMEIPDLEKELKIDKLNNIKTSKGLNIIIKNRLVNSIIKRINSQKVENTIIPFDQNIILESNISPNINSKINSNINSNVLDITFNEIDDIIAKGEEIIPSIRKYQLLGYNTGFQSLNYKIIDYSKEDYPGLISVFGGILTLYRLIAEKTSDLVCKKLKINEICKTSEKEIIFPKKNFDKKELQSRLIIDDKKKFNINTKWNRFNCDLENICIKNLNTVSNIDSDNIVCKSERIIPQEINWAKEKLFAIKIQDIKRRTKLGREKCQGLFCFKNIANFEAKTTKKPQNQILEELEEALQNTWKVAEAGDEFLKRQIKLSKYFYKLGGNL